MRLKAAKHTVVRSVSAFLAAGFAVSAFAAPGEIIKTHEMSMPASSALSISAAAPLPNIQAPAATHLEIPQSLILPAPLAVEPGASPEMLDAASATPRSALTGLERLNRDVEPKKDSDPEQAVQEQAQAFDRAGKASIGYDVPSISDDASEDFKFLKDYGFLVLAQDLLLPQIEREKLAEFFIQEKKNGTMFAKFTHRDGFSPFRFLSDAVYHYWLAQDDPHAKFFNIITGFANRLTRFMALALGPRERLIVENIDVRYNDGKQRSWLGFHPDGGYMRALVPLLGDGTLYIDQDGHQQQVQNSHALIITAEGRQKVFKGSVKATLHSEPDIKDQRLLMVVNLKPQNPGQKLK